MRAWRASQCTYERESVIQYSVRRVYVPMLTARVSGPRVRRRFACSHPAWELTVQGGEAMRAGALDL